MTPLAVVLKVVNLQCLDRIGPAPQLPRGELMMSGSVSRRMLRRLEGEVNQILLVSSLIKEGGPAKVDLPEVPSKVRREQALR